MKQNTRTEGYVTPSMKTITFKNEGLLCASAATMTTTTETFTVRSADNLIWK